MRKALVAPIRPAETITVIKSTEAELTARMREIAAGAFLGIYPVYPTTYERRVRLHVRDPLLPDLIGAGYEIAEHAPDDVVVLRPSTGDRS